jgi:succinate dehydrogenase/fumarate reductase flavoprotein subunit
MLDANIKRRRISTSVLVIGTGGSGLRAAIELSERVIDVLAVGKSPKNDAHTSLAARSTIECALERRESRGAHNRSDYPELDPKLQVNMVWSADGKITREKIPPIPKEIADLMSDVSLEGKLLE